MHLGFTFSNFRGQHNPTGAVPDLGELARGVITEAQPWACPQLVPGCPPEPVRHQCREAILNRDLKLWTCATTGDRCGAPGYPACETPKLFTWVEDFVEGVLKLPVTPAGEVIYPPKPIAAPLSTGGSTTVPFGGLLALVTDHPVATTLGAGAVVGLVYLVFGGRR